MDKRIVTEYIRDILTMDSDYEKLEVSQFDLDRIMEAFDEAIIEQASELLIK